MQAGQPVVVFVVGVIGGEFAIVQAGATGLQLGVFIANTGDDAQVIDIQGVHQVGGVDVFFDGEVIDA